ncbi:MAG: hypothetical protein DDT27_01281 [Dehalococcoidia bacterium]|nr:hypothetical protein [Chloroflexota bacterium]
MESSPGVDSLSMGYHFKLSTIAHQYGPGKIRRKGQKAIYLSILNCLASFIVIRGPDYFRFPGLQFRGIFSLYGLDYLMAQAPLCLPGD